MLKQTLKDNRGSAQNWILAIAFVFIIGVGIYAILFKNVLPKAPAKKTPQTTQQTTSGSTAPVGHQALTVSDIVKRPNIYETKEVILLRTQFKGWVTERSFTIIDIPVTNNSNKNSLFNTNTNTQSSGTPLFAMAKAPFPLPEDAQPGQLALGESGKKFRLEGTVYFFKLLDFEAKLGVDFSPSDERALKSYEGKPVLLIDKMELLQK